MREGVTASVGVSVPVGVGSAVRVRVGSAGGVCCVIAGKEGAGRQAESRTISIEMKRAKNFFTVFLPLNLLFRCPVNCTVDF